MFNVGEKVIYGAVGVCQISDISKNKLTGVERQYYVLHPVDTDKSVIYVPVDNQKLVDRIRIVPTADELNKILANVKNRELLWIDDNLERSEKFHSILNDGDIEEIVMLVRALHNRELELSNIGKRLPKSDERIFKEASRLLCSEFSSILDIENSEILSLVLDVTS